MCCPHILTHRLIPWALDVERKQKLAQFPSIILHLFHIPHPLLVGIYGEGPAVHFFILDQVILYYFLCFLQTGKLG